MKRLIPLAVFVAFILVGFTPDLFMPQPAYSFNVPTNTSGRGFHGLPPGTYQVRSTQWYTFHVRCFYDAGDNRIKTSVTSHW